MSSRERADTALVSRGFCPSREKAQAAIMAGQVYAGGRRIQKPSEALNPEDELTVRRPAVDYVSRGALKLEKAVRVFDADLRDRVVLDIGASTGGFTDVCLRNGARKVYAVDVGYGQLAWKLRTDERVVNMERTNIRNVTPEDIGSLLDFASIDVAFISLTKVLPVAYNLLTANGELVALIKPQFEAGREHVGKKGVVRDPKIHEAVISKVTEFSRELGFCPLALTYSPVKGPEGNIEYLIRLSKDKAGEDTVSLEKITAVVAAAHGELDKPSDK